jgi:long-chain acyl-CoA synthetase
LIARLTVRRRALGIRAGDRMMIVSENSIPLACLLLAASRLDAWAIVANPRLSPRELDQIRDHSGARRAFFTAAVSEEAAAHATRYDAPLQDVGPLHSVGVSALNGVALPEPVEADGANQVAVLIYTSGARPECPRPSCSPTETSYSRPRVRRNGAT